MTEPEWQRIIRQNNAIIDAISGLAEAVDRQTTLLETLNEWMREPDTRDLGDTLATMAHNLHAIGLQVSELLTIARVHFR